MTRRPPAFPALLAALVLTAVAAGIPLRAEDAKAAPAAGAAPGEQGSGASGGSDTINRIKQGNEAMLSGRGFTYDPAGRRDPFRSLVDALNSQVKGPRPRCIPDLVGIVQKGKGYIAFFNGSDNKGYFLRVGDAVYDGKIIRIDRRTGSVVFRQDVNDPRSIKPYRDVTKRLTTAEEGSL